MKFDAPLEILQNCHGRIEAQLATLERLGPHLRTRGCDRPAREAAAAVVRYFDREGEAHQRDEDEDLFPLLRELAAREGRDEIAAVLDEIEREHASLHALWSRLRAELQGIARGEAGEATRALDASAVTRFAWLYRRHMERESGAVLPYAREALSEDQRAALGVRMAERRKMFA